MTNTNVPTFKIVRKPVTEVACPMCARRLPRGGGVLFRVDLSRLEEGMGHEGFQCDRCGYAVKYVPADDRPKGGTR